MELIIQEIIQKIISHCEKGLEELIMKKIDISGFIMNTKKMLDDVGKIIVADTLETINEIYRNSKERKRDWTIKKRQMKRPMELYLAKSDMRGHTIRIKKQVNIATCQMRL